MTFQIWRPVIKTKMPENQEINQISIKFAVQKEKIKSLENYLNLQDKLFNQKIENLEKNIANSLFILDQRIVHLQNKLQNMQKF